MFVSMCDDHEEMPCSMTNRMKAARGCLLAASVVEGRCVLGVRAPEGLSLGMSAAKAVTLSHMQQRSGLTT